MLKLTVFAALLAFCCAQPQPCETDKPRPVLPETFVSTSSVFRKIGHTEMRGQGTWYRSESEQAFMEKSIYDNGTESNEHLGLFMKHEEYDIKLVGGKKVCTPKKIPEDQPFPMIWDLLKNATCHKFTDKRTGNTYDAWSEHLRDGSDRALLVDEKTPNTPVALLSRLHELEYDMRFMSFEAMEPAATAFAVPNECMPPKN